MLGDQPHRFFVSIVPSSFDIPLKIHLLQGYRASIHPGFCFSFCPGWSREARDCNIRNSAPFALLLGTCEHPDSFGTSHSKASKAFWKKSYCPSKRPARQSRTQYVLHTWILFPCLMNISFSAHPRQGRRVFINLLKCLEIIFNTLIILGVLWFAGLVYGRAVGHGLFSMKGNE